MTPPMFNFAFATAAVVAACFALRSAVAAAPAPLASGIYRLAEEGQGVAVERASGGKLSLGELASTNLGEVEITAANDGNTRFQFRFPQAGPLSGADADGQYAIYLAGFAEPVGSSSDPDAEGHQDLSCWFDDRDVAERWAKALGKALPQREHPGFRMLTTFEPVRDEYRVGEEVELRMTIRNVGQQPFTFMDGGQQRGPRNNQFRFIAWKGYAKDFAVPDVGDRTNFGGMGGYVTLKEGETFEKIVKLSDWFRFEEPETYEITGLFEMEFLDPDSPRYRPIWDDFAVGTCQMRIIAVERAATENEPPDTATKP